MIFDQHLTQPGSDTTGATGTTTTVPVVPGAAFDYYKTLGLERSADDAAVKKAYRRMALKHHPEKSTHPGSAEVFQKIAEAYDVLSDARRRAVYDQYGAEGLRAGVPPRDGYPGFAGGYKFHGNAMQVFSDFFGGTNPFADFFSVHTETGRTFPDKLGGMHGMNKMPAETPGLPFGPVQDPPISYPLIVSLEELYLGGTRKVKVTKMALNEDGVTTSEQGKVLTIDIQPGWKEGTRITFEKEGDQGPNVIPADIVFIVKQKPHEYFERRGNDLLYTTEIPLLKALTGTVVDIVTLDGRKLKIPVNEVIRPDYIKEVPNEGMPLSKEPETRGRLLITFKVAFPSYLKEEQKKLIVKALS